MLSVIFYLCLASVTVNLVFSDDTVTATCNLFHYESNQFIGKVNFSQTASSDVVTIHGCVKELTAGPHGFHVHQFGDISNNCLGAGGHFNPEKKTHGNISDAERHVGDLGNLAIIQSGSGEYCFPPFSDKMISLMPGKHNIIGRVLAIHRDPDDLGRGSSPDSKTTGNSGPRIACCVIGLTSDFSGGMSVSSSPVLLAILGLLCFLRSRLAFGCGNG